MAHAWSFNFPQARLLRVGASQRTAQERACSPAGGSRHFKVRNDITQISHRWISRITLRLRSRECRLALIAKARCSPCFQIPHFSLDCPSHPRFDIVGLIRRALRWRPLAGLVHSRVHQNRRPSRSIRSSYVCKIPSTRHLTRYVQDSPDSGLSIVRPLNISTPTRRT